MNDFISKSIRKKYYYGKGYGFEAVENIPKGTVIIKETPIVNLFDMNIDDSVEEMLHIIYRCMNHTDKNITKKFLNLVPSSLCKRPDDTFIFKLRDLKDCINNLDSKIKNYFKSLSQNELILYCLKYTRNVFGYWIHDNNRKSKRIPAVLFNGAILNHSCIPNVIFFGKDGQMVFVASRDIKIGEEICDTYIDLFLNKKDRQTRLLNQYGFNCECNRCKANDKSYESSIAEIEKFKKNVSKLKFTK